MLIMLNLIPLEYVKIMESITIEIQRDGQIYAYKHRKFIYVKLVDLVNLVY